MSSKAIASGSVTLFFQIDSNSSGSRGVGVCVEPGAITQVSKGNFAIFLNGERIEGKIQRRIAERLNFKGIIETKVHLPVSQGFGMSAAIALSTALAIADFKGIDANIAAIVTHETEIEMGTGLGDVASELVGGFTYRRTPGIPPTGKIEKIEYDGLINLVVLGPKIPTNQIIKEQSWKRKIAELGTEAIAKFERARTWRNALNVGREFSFSLGLMSRELRNFLEECKNATQALLGNSAIVFGSCDEYEGKMYSVKLGHKARVGDFQF